VVQGIEVDGRWALTESLTMAYGLAYLDHEYKDYTSGNCFNGQVPDGDVVNGMSLCDYISLSHLADLTSDLRLQTSFDLSYRGEQNVHVNLDPNGVVGSNTQMNFRMAVQAENWDVALLVQNLSDEQQLINMNNAPLSSSFGTNTFYSFIARPRATLLQLNYRF
jgi:iron complex outermembrane receptor protein